MAMAAEEMVLLEQLDNTEREIVISFATSLIRNRGEHTADYNRFQDIRRRMVTQNPMSMQKIDDIIHA